MFAEVYAWFFLSKAILVGEGGYGDTMKKIDYFKEKGVIVFEVVANSQKWSSGEICFNLRHTRTIILAINYDLLKKIHKL